MVTRRNEYHNIPCWHPVIIINARNPSLPSIGVSALVCYAAMANPFCHRSASSILCFWGGISICGCGRIIILYFFELLQGTLSFFRAQSERVLEHSWHPFIAGALYLACVSITLTFEDTKLTPTSKAFSYAQQLGQMLGALAWERALYIKWGRPLLSPPLLSRSSPLSLPFGGGSSRAAGMHKSYSRSLHRCFSGYSLA